MPDPASEMMNLGAGPSEIIRQATESGTPVSPQVSNATGAEPSILSRVGSGAANLLHAYAMVHTGLAAQEYQNKERERAEERQLYDAMFLKNPEMTQSPSAMSTYKKMTSPERADFMQSWGATEIVRRHKEAAAEANIWQAPAGGGASSAELSSDPKVLEREVAQARAYQSTPEYLSHVERTPEFGKLFESHLKYAEDRLKELRAPELEARKMRAGTTARIEAETSPSAIAAQTRLAGSKSAAEASARIAAESSAPAITAAVTKVIAEESARMGIKYSPEAITGAAKEAAAKALAELGVKSSPEALKASEAISGASAKGRIGAEASPEALNAAEAKTIVTTTARIGAEHTPEAIDAEAKKVAAVEHAKLGVTSSPEAIQAAADKAAAVAKATVPIHKELADYAEALQEKLKGITEASARQKELHSTISQLAMRRVAAVATIDKFPDQASRESVAKVFNDSADKIAGNFDEADRMPLMGLKINVNAPTPGMFFGETPGVAAPQIVVGTTATNPTTKEKVVWNGHKWERLSKPATARNKAAVSPTASPEATSTPIPGATSTFPAFAEPKMPYEMYTTGMPRNVWPER